MASSGPPPRTSRSMIRQRLVLARGSSATVPSGRRRFESAPTVFPHEAVLLASASTTPHPTLWRFFRFFRAPDCPAVNQRMNMTQRTWPSAVAGEAGRAGTAYFLVVGRLATGIGAAGCHPRTVQHQSSRQRRERHRASHPLRAAAP